MRDCGQSSLAESTEALKFKEEFQKQHPDIPVFFSSTEPGRLTIAEIQLDKDDLVNTNQILDKRNYDRSVWNHQIHKVIEP